MMFCESVDHYFQVSFVETGNNHIISFAAILSVIGTHRNVLVFASFKSSSNVVEVIPPAASRAEAKNNIVTVTTKSLASEADADDTDGEGGMIFHRAKLWNGINASRANDTSLIDCSLDIVK